MATKAAIPVLGADNANWASFSAAWECYLELHDFGELTGNAAAREKDKQKRAFYLLTLHTRDNARAQEFMIRRKAEETAAGKDLSGDSAFNAMGDLFRPDMEQHKANAIEAVKTAMQACWTRMDTKQERDNAVVDVQMKLNECVQLQCKPPESQLVIQFLRTMPMDGDWAVRKITWMDSQIATVNEMIEKIRAAELGNEEETTGVRSFMASRAGLAKPQCKICKKFHGGECRYKHKHRGEHRRNFNDSEKRCFVCGKKGHISFNCPKRKRSGDDSDGSGDSDMDYEAFKKAKRQMKKNKQEIQVPGF
jgi:hypothetical protein